MSHLKSLGLLLLASAIAASSAHANANVWPPVAENGIDPSIAAGPGFVLMSQYDQIYVYDSTGVLKQTISPYDLFYPLFDPSNVTTNLNDQLGLANWAPGTVIPKCYRDHPFEDTVTIGGATVPNYCLTKLYDGRVAYDEYNHHFIVLMVAFNKEAKCKYNADAFREARRTKFVVAVSNSDNLLDGKPWTLSSGDATPGESCTTDACRFLTGYAPGDSADNPRIAVVKGYLMTAIKVDSMDDYSSCPEGVGGDGEDDEDPVNDKTAVMHVWSTAALSTGHWDTTTCNGPCKWSYHGSALGTDSTGASIIGKIYPAKQHGSTAYKNSAWFVQSDPADLNILKIWHFSLTNTGSAPTLMSTSLTLPADAQFDADQEHTNNHYPQPSTTAGKLKINFTVGLVQRNNKLYYADVGGVNGSGDLPDPGIRMVELSGDWSGLSFTVLRHAIFHSDGYGYGSPAMDVDAGDHIALSYRKVGGTTSLIGFGARYLTWSLGAGTPLGHTLLDNAAIRSSDGSNFDTAATTVDPAGTFYFMVPFVSSPTHWSYAVGSVSVP